MEVKSNQKTSAGTDGKAKAKSRRKLFSRNLDNELIIAVPSTPHINFSIYEDSFDSNQSVHCPDMDVGYEVLKMSREIESVTTVKHAEMDASPNNTVSSTLSSGGSD